MIFYGREGVGIEAYPRDKSLQSLESLVLVLGDGDLEALGLKTGLGSLESLGADGLGVSSILEVGNLLVSFDKGLKGGIGESVLRAGRHFCECMGVCGVRERESEMEWDKDIQCMKGMGRYL